MFLFTQGEQWRHAIFLPPILLVRTSPVPRLHERPSFVGHPDPVRVFHLPRAHQRYYGEPSGMPFYLSNREKDISSADKIRVFFVCWFYFIAKVSRTQPSLNLVYNTLQQFWMFLACLILFGGLFSFFSFSKNSSVVDAKRLSKWDGGKKYSRRVEEAIPPTSCQGVIASRVFVRLYLSLWIPAAGSGKRSLFHRSQPQMLSGVCATAKW